MALIGRLNLKGLEQPNLLKSITKNLIDSLSMEQTNNNAPALDLCHSCKSFYGSKERDYLCSSCFKDKNVTA